MIRAISIIAVVIENYTSYSLSSNVITVPSIFTYFVQNIAGTFVHLFFVISGYGLTLPFLREKTTNWKVWARRRFLKIVVPYWVTVTITYSLTNICHYWIANCVQPSYSWFTLFTYITFLRNFYSPGWTLNWTLWFMPIIVGLYIIFPLLLKVLKRYGVVYFMVFSLLLANSPVLMLIQLGYPMSHQSSIFLFYVDEFAFGMVLAYLTNVYPELLCRLMKFRFFCLGIFFYFVSGLIAEFKLMGIGSIFYKDILECIGLYVMMLHICNLANKFLSPSILNIFNKVSDNSYTIYLIHGPIIVLGLKPFYRTFFVDTMGNIPLILSAGAFSILMYFSAKSISLIGVLIRRRL